MRPQYSTTVEPHSEPITLAQASDHLRVDSTDDQSYISDLISVAREYFDSVTGRASAETTYLLTAESWWDLVACPSTYEIPIFRSPLASVASVQYYASGDTVLTTMPTTDYRVITGAEPGRIQLVSSPPAVEDRIDAIQITFIAGNNCPPAMSKHAIKMLVSNYYDQRAPIVTGTIATEIPYTLKAIIENQKIGGNF